MREKQVRRLAVTSPTGTLVGMLSLNDLAQAAARRPGEIPSDEITQTLAAIGQPYRAPAQSTNP